MKISVKLLVGAACIGLVACSGPSLEERFEPGCLNIVSSSDDFGPQVAKQLCSCLYETTAETIEGEQLEAFVQVFETSSTPKEFEDNMEEALGTELYRSLGNKVDHCEDKIEG